jgi:hypothetical protein
MCIPHAFEKEKIQQDPNGNKCKKEGKECQTYSLPLLLGLLSFCWVGDLSAQDSSKMV